VLGVTATAEDLPSAIERAYVAVSKIHFEGMHYRRDIGAKGLRRIGRDLATGELSVRRAPGLPKV